MKYFIRAFLITFFGVWAVSDLSAQPPGLQGPFVPIEVVNVNAGPSETVATVDYYAQTVSYADIYERDSDAFNKSQMVSRAEEIIGTPWEGATCAALLDAGFVEPCAIPPNQQSETDPIFQDANTCRATLGGMTGVSGSKGLPSCVSDTKDWLAGPGSANGGSVTGVACVDGNDGFGPAGTTRYYRVLWSGFNGDLARWYPEFGDNANCGGSEPYVEPPEEPTDDEIYEAIRPAINNQYFYDYSTQRIDPGISQFSTTATNITNNYISYQGDWESGDPLTPPGASPIPIPQAPQSPQPQTIEIELPDFPEPTPGQCEEFPDSVGCIDVDSNIGDQSDIPDGAALTELAVGDMFAPVFLSAASSCPSPHVIPFMGSSIEISYDTICDFGPSVSPLFLLISALSGLMIIVGGKTS